MTERETGTCRVCNSRTVQMRREPEKHICDGCARYWPREEVT